jgi:hypothetical protein
MGVTGADFSSAAAPASVAGERPFAALVSGVWGVGWDVGWGVERDTGDR